MRLAAALAVLGLAAHAQAARIEGRIVQAPGAEAAGDLAVQLLGVNREGETLSRETRSDADGRYSFDELGAGAVYLVMADYRGIRFPGGRAVVQPGEEDATRTLDFRVYEPSSDASALEPRIQRFFLERGDAGTYRVTQTLSAYNGSDRVVRTPDSEPPALRAGLFEGHGPVQTRFGGLPEGARVEGDVLELRGPFFPGDDELIVAYEVDVGGRDLRDTLRLPSGAEDLELWVRDQGVDIDAGPLHPARVTRTPEGFYQRFLGFDLLPGTEIPISLTARPPPGPGAVWPQVVLAFALSLGLAYLVGAPVTRAAVSTETPEESPAEREKQALFVALRDLEHDYETDKLSREDHDRLREELRADALRALARLEGPAAARVPDVKPEERVCDCGRVAQPGDRFCAGCGTAL